MVIVELRMHAYCKDIIPPKLTIYEDFKDWICALADKFQMNPKTFLFNVAFSAQLPCIADTPFKDLFTFV